MESENRLSVTAVVPSLNPTRQLVKTVEGLLAVGFTGVVLVNDGSAPEALSYFEEAARSPKVTLLTHPANQGKGAAMKMGTVRAVAMAPAAEMKPISSRTYLA